MSSKYAILILALLATVVLGACTSEDPTEGAPALQPMDGEVLYAENCSRCHGFDEGGNITDIPPPHNKNGHTWHHPDQQLTEIILDGLDFAVEGQQTMPAFRDTLSAEEVRAILDYIKTWWTEEQREFQATVTAGAQR